MVSPTLTFERSAKATLKVTNSGCIYWQNPVAKAEATTSIAKQGQDFIVQDESIGDREQLIVVTDSGKAYPVTIDEIPRA